MERHLLDAKRYSVYYLFVVGDYTRMSYTYYNITDGTERITLDLNPIDDNIVEADETYYLTILVLYSSSHSRVIASETKKTTKIIIYDNDGKQLYM